MTYPVLTAEQEALLAEANRELEAGMEDSREDGLYDVDACFADLVEAAAWDIKDPVVRAEFHRMHGCIDRKTGIDPMEDV